MAILLPDVRQALYEYMVPRLAGVGSLYPDGIPQGEFKNLETTALVAYSFEQIEAVPTMSDAPGEGPRVGSSTGVVKFEAYSRSKALAVGAADVIRSTLTGHYGSLGVVRLKHSFKLIDGADGEVGMPDGGEGLVYVTAVSFSFGWRT